jgi:hypothetical protein
MASRSPDRMRYTLVAPDAKLWMRIRLPIHLVFNYPTASRYAFLAIIELVSTAVGYLLDPDARETLRRIKYTVLNHRKGKVSEPLGD